MRCAVGDGVEASLTGTAAIPEQRLTFPPLLDVATQWLHEADPTILVEVMQGRGSVPREAGTRMLVSAAQSAGTIGGGHLEWRAIASARAMLDEPKPAPRTEHFPLGPALGQCCGGTVTLAYSLLDQHALTRWPHAPPRFDLQLYGAGHVGRAIARALAPLNVRVDWIDEREREFMLAEREASAWKGGPARIRTLCVDAIDAEVSNAAPGAFYLVLTHQHDLDLRITEAILRRGDFGYLGLIGSKTKKQRFLHRFEQQGLAAELLARITCPIGVPGVRGKEPEVLAAAVVAQLLQASSPLRD